MYRKWPLPAWSIKLNVPVHISVYTLKKARIYRIFLFLAHTKIALNIFEYYTFIISFILLKNDNNY